MARRTRILIALALGVALLVEAVALYQAQQGESASYDEPELLYSGVRSWKTGDFSVSPHPPLTKLMAGLPVWLVLDPALPPDPADRGPVEPIRTAWGEGKLFLFENQTPGADATSMLRLARLSPLVMWLVMIAAVAGWSWELYGPRAALVSAGLAMSCPIGLASGQILSTDVGGASFATLGAWMFARALHRPTTARFSLAGLAYGLALGARYQPVALFACACALGLVLTRQSRAGVNPDGEPLAPRPAGIRATLRGIFVALACAFATLLALYRVTSIAHYPMAIHFLATRLGPGGSIPFFLDGETSSLGWLAYFPRALVYKLPPPHLIAIALGILSLFVRRPRRAEWLVIGPAALLFALAMASRINYGVRHVLPVLPALYVLFGRLATPRPGGPPRSWQAVLLIAALPILGLAEQIRSHPHYPPYISPVFGGSSTGFRRLADGNIDAGQSLIYLARDMAKHPGESVLLAYHGTGDPVHYGIPYRYLAGYLDQRRLDREPPDTPFPPRHLAVSATYIQLFGLGVPGAFHFLRETPPDRQPGHAILVWDLEARPAWYGPLAGVYLETSLSRYWAEAQQSELRGRATLLLRAMRTRAPEAMPEAMAWLAGRVALLGEGYRAELAFLMAAALGDAGFTEEARALFVGLLDGQYGPVPPLLTSLARDNLRRLRGR